MISKQNFIALIKTSLLVVIGLLLAGCPMRGWNLESDYRPQFQITDSCIRALTSSENVRGVVKTNIYYAHDLQRYLIETSYGVANLDLLYSNNEIPELRLYMQGPDDYELSYNREPIELLLKSLLLELESHCSGARIESADATETIVIHFAVPTLPVLT